MMHEYLHGVVLQSVEVVFQFSIKLSVKYLPFGKRKWADSACLTLPKEVLLFFSDVLF